MIAKRAQGVVIEELRALFLNGRAGHTLADAKMAAQQAFGARERIGVTAFLDAARLAQPFALGDHARQQLIEAGIGCIADGHGERFAERALRPCRRLRDRCVDGPCDDLALLGIIQDAEARRHIGFERKALQ